MNTSVFGAYARYYNLLYTDKDYAAEAQFVLSRLKRAGIRPNSLLDLGCGTGRHALEFARSGLAVSGVDLSPEMIAMSAGLMADCAPGLGRPPELELGDAATVRLGKRFDCVVSLFHVLSYQTGSEKALAVLETAREHLLPGGAFFFDFWYGPGVLADPPVRREKRLQNAETAVLRVAEPVHRIHENIVEVHYAISVTDKQQNTESVFSECHVMRYWFLPELKFLARSSGLSVLAEGAWMETGFAAAPPWNAWLLLGA
jgi:SAM-dependent methyltransferase